MPNPAIQRLIAAGASPTRAKAFADSLMSSRQTPQIGSTAAPKIGGIGVAEIANAQPEVAPVPRVSGFKVPEIGMPQTPAVPAGIKPKGPSEWYSDDYAAASSSWASGKGLPGYQPPAFGTPEFVQYFDYTKGPGSSKKFETSLYTKYAPTYKAALTSTAPLDKAVIPYISKGIAPQQIVAGVMKNSKILGLTLSESDVYSYVTKLFNEYNDAVSKASDFIGTVDKNYRYALPDPKFTYGPSTNFQTGTIDVLNNYWANGKYRAYEQQLKAANKYTPAQISQALSNAKIELAKVVISKGATPFKDETARRDALKKGK